MSVGEAFRHLVGEKKKVCSFCNVAPRHKFAMARGETLLSGRRRWLGLAPAPAAPDTNPEPFNIIFFVVVRDSNLFLRTEI